MIKIAKNSKNFFSENGFSAVEILVALFIFSLISASIIILSFGSQDILANLGTYQNLLSQSQDKLEETKALAFYDFAGVISEENTGGGTEDFLDVSFVYDYTKKIKSRIFKPDSRFREVELFSYVSDWPDSLGADTCFRRLPDAQSYSIVGAPFLLSVYNNATDIDVVLGKAYITIATSSAPNFLIVDVSDSQNPSFISNYFSTSRKLNGLHVAGRHAFTATNSQAEQLQVIDVLNPSTPSLLSEYRLPDPSSTTTASSIFYKDKKVYLGTEKHNGGEEFQIIDISDPLDPKHLGAWEADSKINDIVTKDSFAFIATPNPIPVKVLDVSDYQNIELFDYYETGGNPNHGGQAVALTGNFLALGRSISGIPQPDYHELYLFDISQNSLGFITSKKIGASIRSLILRENFLALTATLGSSNFLQFRSLDEENLLELIYEIPLPGRPRALDCEDDILYVVTENPAKLIIIAPGE